MTLHTYTYTHIHGTFVFHVECVLLARVGVQPMKVRKQSDGNLQSKASTSTSLSSSGRQLTSINQYVVILTVTLLSNSYDHFTYSNTELQPSCDNN